MSKAFGREDFVDCHSQPCPNQSDFKQVEIDPVRDIPLLNVFTRFFNVGE